MFSSAFAKYLVSLKDVIVSPSFSSFIEFSNTQWHIATVAILYKQNAEQTDSRLQ